MEKDTGCCKVSKTEDGFRIDVSGEAMKMMFSSCDCGCNDKEKTDDKDSGCCSTK